MLSGVSCLLAVAARQHQVVTAAQIAECGISRKVLSGLLANGFLIRVRHGIYVVGCGRVSAWQQVVAASLAAGPEAVISHSTAARIHRLALCLGDGPVELSVHRPRHLDLPGVRVHRVCGLPPIDVGAHRGVAVTTPARTLIDVASQIPPVALAKVIDEGLIARTWTIADLEAQTDRSKHRVRADVRRLIASRAIDETVDSHLELRIARVLRPFAPFRTRFQVVLEDRVYVLDIAWPDCLTAVECDGWSVRQMSRSKFDAERRRTIVLQRHGWLVIPLTSAMSDGEMLDVVGRGLDARRGGLGAG